MKTVTTIHWTIRRRNGRIIKEFYTDTIKEADDVFDLYMKSKTALKSAILQFEGKRVTETAF